MIPLQKLKKAPPPPQVVWPYETGPEVFASQKLQGVFPNTSPKGGIKAKALKGVYREL
jgi:hypothetical protein